MVVVGDIKSGLSLAVYNSGFRGLRQSASWALEIIFELGFQLDEEVETTKPSIVSSLAKSYFDQNQLSRAIYLLRKSSNPSREDSFLLYYAEILKVEEIFTSGNLDVDKKALRLGFLYEEFRGLGDKSDSFHLLLLAMFENHLGDYSSAFRNSQESFRLNPYCFDTWKQLASSIVHMPLAIANLSLPEHPMSDLFKLYFQGSWCPSLEYGNIKCPPFLLQTPFAKLQIAGSHYLNLEYQQAEEIYVDIVESCPYSIDGLDCYSDILFLSGRQSDLQELMKRTNVINDSHPITHHVAGNYYALCGDRERAIVYFRKVVRSNTQSTSAWILSAQQYLELRQPEAAIECFTRATEANPHDFRGWFGLGQIYELLDSLPLALEYFSRASRLAPNDHRVYTGLGNCFLLNGQPDRALLILKKALECDHVPKDVYLLIGTTYSKLKRPSDALAYFRQYLESDPSLLNSVEPIDDPSLRSAILAVAKDSQSKGDFLKATLWFSLLSRSHGQVVYFLVTNSIGIYRA